MTTTYTTIQNAFITAATNIGVVPEASVQAAETFVFGLVSYMAWPNGLVVYQAFDTDAHIAITGIGSMSLSHHTESDAMFYSMGGGLVGATLELYVEVDMSRVSPIRLRFLFDVPNNEVVIDFQRSHLIAKDLGGAIFDSFALAEYEKVAKWIHTHAKDVLVNNWWKDDIAGHQTANNAVKDLGLIT